MLICDRCLKNRGVIRCYCFGQVGGEYPGLTHHDLCPDCAKEFAEQFDCFVNHDKSDSLYATAEWQEQLTTYEDECRRRGKQ